jgi:hypothetical protein
MSENGGWELTGRPSLIKMFATPILSLLACGEEVSAQQPPIRTVCTAADLKGDFVAQPQGILTAGPFAGPFSATGVVHFDGKGAFTGVATTSFFGHVIYPFPADGTYTVTPDCFVSIVEEVLHIRFVGFFSSSRNEVLMVEPDADSITANTLHRIVDLSCANASLSGNWVLNGTGTYVRNGHRTAQAQRINFDGAGNMTGTRYSSVEGKFSNTTLVGTYAMNRDCTFLGRATDALGNVDLWFGTLFNEGEQIKYNYREDGLVFAGQGRTSLN